MLDPRMEHLNRSIAASASRKAHPRTPKPLEHGTRYAYVRHGCRCEECGAANRDYQREHRAKPVAIPPHVHGRPNTYSRLGCRCRPCQRAATAYRMRFSFAASERLKRVARRKTARKRYLAEWYQTNRKSIGDAA